MTTEETTAVTPSSSIYVGDLTPSVDEQALIDTFSKVGPVYHARVCRDITTKYSLGYGYVNYCDPKHAEIAITALNYEVIHNRPIRLMWSQRDPSLRKSGKGNIFIKNLDKNITQKQLYDTFENVGKILSCKIAFDDQGQSKGFGYIHFENETDADKAIAKINGMQIHGCIVYVGHFQPRSCRASNGPKPKFNNLYVKSFPPETTDSSLEEMFSEFGEITSACVAQDQEGKSRGFGFVCFKEPEHAEAAYNAMNGKELDGRQLYVNRAQKKEERTEELKQKIDKQKADRQSKYERGVNLYVKNLDDTVDDAALEKAFSNYGSITSAKVMRDAQGRSRGFGFVCFSQADEATRAVCEMGSFLLGSKPLYVALAQRKEDRRQQMVQELNRIPQTRFAVGQVMPNPNAPGYFQQASFPRAPQYFAQGMVPNQPRWNRPVGMPGANMPQMAYQRPAGGPHYFSPGNAASAIAQMALRQPALVRQMLPGNVPAGGVAGVNAAMMQGQPRRQPVPQMNANGMQQQLGVNQVRNMQPRHINAQSMPRSMPVQFTQSNRMAGVEGMSVPMMSALGDQLSMRQAQQQAIQQPPAPTKVELGDRLFAMVSEFDGARASKLTGMMLGLDDTEIIHILNNRDALKSKIDEASTLLESVEGNRSADLALQNRGDVNGTPAAVSGKEGS